MPNNKNFKLIAVGDTHGRDNWKKILEQEKEFDRFIFIGDYFDTREGISVDQQIKNFTEILDFKKANPDKVVLIIGNHDFHYLKGAGETYSGYAQYAAMDINEVLEPAVSSGHIQICYIYDELLFSHAGVTKTWVEENDIDFNNLEQSINILFMKNLEAFRFTYGENLDRSGDDVCQSPIWVRIPSLLKDMVQGFIFVIGHTTLKELYMDNNIIGIDCLGTSGEYLVIIDGMAYAKNLNDENTNFE
jgi:hypothetical protein